MYGDGKHDPCRFLHPTKRPKPLTEDGKMKQINVKVVDPKEVQSACRCGDRQNCWSCKPEHPWAGPWAFDKEEEHVFNVDYKRIVPRVSIVDVSDE